MASKSRCVIKAIYYLDQKAIRCAFFFGYFHLGKQKKVTRRQGETKANEYQTATTSVDEPKAKPQSESKNI